MTGRHRVCKRLALLGLLLPLAPGPGLAGEKEAAEAASCEAPAAVEQIRGLAGIVDRAVGVEARRAGASEPATTVVLNGRGYNYGPARETPPPGR